METMNEAQAKYDRELPEDLEDDVSEGDDYESIVGYSMYDGLPLLDQRK